MTRDESTRIPGTYTMESRTMTGSLLASKKSVDHAARRVITIIMCAAMLYDPFLRKYRAMRIIAMAMTRGKISSKATCPVTMFIAIMIGTRQSIIMLMTKMILDFCCRT